MYNGSYSIKPNQTKPNQTKTGVERYCLKSSNKTKTLTSAVEIETYAADIRSYVFIEWAVDPYSFSVI